MDCATQRAANVGDEICHTLADIRQSLLHSELKLCGTCADLMSVGCICCLRLEGESR